MELKDPDLLAALMASKKISGRALSESAGWQSHTYLQRLLRGEVTTLKPGPAIAIAECLGVPVDVLFVSKVDRITEQVVQERRPKQPA
jgi:transcriptional regulator with XRE-family HTH domain